MAETNERVKLKFNRTYETYNANRYIGPNTEIYDTVLKPIQEKEDA